MWARPLLRSVVAGLTIAIAAGCAREADPGAAGGPAEMADSVPPASADTALPTASPGGDPASFSYGCGGEVRFVATMRGSGESVRLLLPDTTVVLPRVVSASGAMFGEGPYVYWSKGEEARLEIAGRTFPSCVSDDGGPGWQEAKARGVRYRAVGQEPGWILDIRRDGGVDIEADYGEAVYHLPPADPEVDPGAGRTVYRIETDTHRATVVIDDQPCRDAMSGWPSETTVSLDLDGRELRGCGRWL